MLEELTLNGKGKIHNQLEGKMWWIVLHYIFSIIQNVAKVELECMSKDDPRHTDAVEASDGIWRLLCGNNHIKDFHDGKTVINSFHTTHIQAEFVYKHIAPSIKPPI